MICKKPYRNGVMEYGCGQCMPCRINKSREWVGRMLLERMEHPASSFVTLTYNEEFVPCDGSLQKKHVQLFLKRLRSAVFPRVVRYFAVGEYGEVSWRPHYHMLLYGIFPTEQAVVEKCWPYGFVQVGTAEEASMKYVSGYILKRMTKPGLAALKGRTPEFALMSRKPGLGAAVVDRIARSVEQHQGKEEIVSKLAGVKRMRLTARKYPMGRYLHEKTMERCGVDEDAKIAVRVQSVLSAWERKSVCSTEDYERGRKARVEQQNYNRKGRSL